MSNNERNSFATKEDLKKSEDFQSELNPKEQQSELQRKVTKAQAPVLEKLDRIALAIEKQTEATNALITTLVGQVRKVIPLDGGGKATVTTSLQPAPTGQVTVNNPPLPPPEPELPDSVNDVEVVKGSFPADLENLLYFSEQKDNEGRIYIKIKPRQFLGADYFAKVARIIRELGGEYISAGKESHFRLYKNK